MMKVETNERHDIFEGTAADIVNAMNAATFIEESSKFEYMTAVARRVKIITGCVIADDNARTFLYGLQRAGLITIQYDLPEQETLFEC